MGMFLLIMFAVFQLGNSVYDPNSTCGKNSFVCDQTSFEPCCSQYGWCGSTTAYCGTGCQSKFGRCNAPSSTINSASTEVVGYYQQTWLSRQPIPNANLAVNFGGSADTDTALSDAQQSYYRLKGAKWISIGGGNSNGRWTASTIVKLNSAINSGKIKKAGYVGICYDIEEADAGLASAFAKSFSTAKASQLGVLVTVSYQASYGLQDGASVMRAIFASSDVDYLSPQLYTTGKETKNDYSLNKDGTNSQITWESYSAAHAQIVPSIANAGLASDSSIFFAKIGITTHGYLSWT
jgi:hypothetical protein